MLLDGSEQMDDLPSESITKLRLTALDPSQSFPRRVAALRFIAGSIHLSMEARAEVILSLFASMDGFGKLAVLETIGILDTPVVLEFLQGLLSDQHYASQAARALGKMGHGSTIRKVLDSEDTHASLGLLSGLREWGSVEAVDILLDVQQKHRDGQLRILAGSILVSMGNKQAIQHAERHLFRLARLQDPELRSQCIGLATMLARNKSRVGLEEIKRLTEVHLTLSHPDALLLEMFLTRELPRRGDYATWREEVRSWVDEQLATLDEE